MPHAKSCIYKLDDKAMIEKVQTLKTWSSLNKRPYTVNKNVTMVQSVFDTNVKLRRDNNNMESKKQFFFQGLITLVIYMYKLHKDNCLPASLTVHIQFPEQ